MEVICRTNGSQPRCARGGNVPEKVGCHDIRGLFAVLYLQVSRFSPVIGAKRGDSLLDSSAASLLPSSSLWPRPLASRAQLPSAVIGSPFRPAHSLTAARESVSGRERGEAEGGGRRRKEEGEGGSPSGASSSRTCCNR